jgi:ABC-type transporter MlaC component
MTNWLVHQFESLNVLMLIIMISFVTALSKSNNQKMLKEQSQEFYNDIEEIKDELREQHQSLSSLIQAKGEKK